MQGTKDLFAMKKLKKSEMIKKDQVWHAPFAQAISARDFNFLPFHRCYMCTQSRKP